MKRAAWIVVAVLVIVAVALTANTITVSNETKGAEVTAEGGEILELSNGDLQVVETPAQTDKPGAPVVLIHGYAASLHWWDSIVPLLSEDHRVITIDLLGHGGSEKPAGGYEMENQASIVAEALNRLRVQGAVVVGHSMGGSVATALATQSSELADRVVIVDSGPNNDDYGPGLPLLAKLGYMPVIGQLLNRITPDSAVEEAYKDGFAPGYDIESGFENPDQVVDDYRAMTYTSFDESHDAADSYTEESPLNERLADAAVPVMVIFGAEDQIVHADEAIAAYEEIPGVRTATIEGAGHSPHVETPEETAPLILEFAADAGDEVLAPAPESAAGGGKGKAKNGRENEEIKGKGRKAREKEETQDQAPNADKNNAGGSGGGGPNAEKGQKPPSDQRPGGN
jgi:pimeloyl-ACP methyl ester carboxylesterase